MAWCMTSGLRISKSRSSGDLDPDYDQAVEADGIMTSHFLTWGYRVRHVPHDIGVRYLRKVGYVTLCVSCYIFYFCL